jgi:F420-dependent oxidoreductase-like protein
MDIAIMIEGQNGLTWPRWQRIARAVEDLGFAGLYRSDHFTNATPPDRDSLELWVSLAWLATHTRRIEFGPLVTPFSFRHPALTARMAAAVDDLSGGRLTLGLGAGWQEREHAHFGFDLLDLRERFRRFREGMQAVTLLLRSDEPASMEGRYFRLREAVMLPRPQRPGGPPILVGGNGASRTLALAARYADQWNGVLVPPARFRELNTRLTALLEARGRPPGAVRRTLMTGLVFGRTGAEVEARLRGRKPEDLRARGVVLGTPAAVAEQLAAFAQAGVERLMVQWLDVDDLDGLRAFAAVALA